MNNLNLIRAPAISIIVPIYNAAKFLDKCIHSALDQDFTDFELLLIDDGSTDDSLGICQLWAEKDTRVTVTHQHNRGVSAAKNLGMSQARGEFICFLDADDWLEAKMLGEMAAHIEPGVDLVLGGIIQEDINGRTTHRLNASCEGIYSLEDCSRIVTDLSINSMLNFCVCKLYRHSVLKGLNLQFDESISLAEDTLFNLELLPNLKSLYTSQKCYYHYLNHGGVSLSRSGNPEAFYILANVIDIYKATYEKLNIFNPELDEYLLDRYGIIIIGSIRYYGSPACNRGFNEHVKYIKTLFDDPRYLGYFQRVDFRKYDSKLGIIANLRNPWLCVAYVWLTKMRYRVKRRFWHPRPSEINISQIKHPGIPR